MIHEDYKSNAPCVDSWGRPNRELPLEILRMLLEKLLIDIKNSPIHARNGPAMSCKLNYFSIRQKQNQKRNVINITIELQSKQDQYLQRLQHIYKFILMGL